MAFEKNTAFEKQIEFKNGANASVFEFPKSNFFAAMDLDINLQVDIGTAVMVTKEQEQIARCIELLEIWRDGKDVVWQMPGELLSRLFRYRQGVQAAGNAEIAVDVANNVQGRLFLHIPFYPLDAVNPSDYAMDTNAHKYELKIKFRNIESAGVLFKNVSTGGATLTHDAAGCYIDLTLHKLTPVPGPSGEADSYQKRRPYFMGLTYRTDPVIATTSDFEIKLPENKIIRAAKMFTYANAAAAANPVGSSSVFSGALTLKNTQGRVVQTIKATTLRELTSLKRRNASLEAGLYDFDMTEFGHIVDSLLSDGIAPLKIVAPVAKQTNETYVSTVIESVEQQGTAR